MRLFLIATAAAVLLSGGAAVAQAYEGSPPYGWSHAHPYHGWQHHRFGNRNSWSLHHGRNPMGSDANGQ